MPVELALLIPRREGLRHSGGAGELMVLEESDGESREKCLALPGAVANASGRKIHAVEPVIAMWLLAPSMSET